MPSINDAYEKVLSLMDKDGFLPKGLCCNRCGKELGGQNSGVPAETYLGTYNGLCYGCTNSGPYPVDKEYVSKAKAYSHPPYSPSWRRDRELFLWFEDCEACYYGRTVVSRSDAFGGSYTTQCKACCDRHENHPLIKRIRLHIAQHDFASAVWYDRLQAEFEKRLKKKGIPINVPEGDIFRAPWEEIAKEVIKEAPPIPPPESTVVAEFPKKWAKGKSLLYRDRVKYATKRLEEISKK